METKILGNVKVNVTTREEILSTLRTRLNRNQQTVLYFLNAHCYNIAQKDKIYWNNISQADFVLNDGIGVELGAKIYNFKFNENLNGTDLTPQLLSMAAKDGHTVYLLGGKPGVAAEAKEKLEGKIPGLNIVGYSHGYFINNDEIIEDINRVKPDIILVGMGVPIQEKWIYAHKDVIDSTLFIAVGAYIDFASERIKRAPLLFRKMRIEWLYRLMLEPKRLWKRNLGSLVFLYNIIKRKWQKK